LEGVDHPRAAAQIDGYARARLWHERALRHADRCSPRGYQGNSFQRPSETTSTVLLVTLMAVWSSIAYVGAGILAAHCSAMAMSW
jgi:hypothetical protein